MLLGEGCMLMSAAGKRAIGLRCRALRPVRAQSRVGGARARRLQQIAAGCRLAGAGAPAASCAAPRSVLTRMSIKNPGVTVSSGIQGEHQCRARAFKLP
jgi:hypothetical protein